MVLSELYGIEIGAWAVGCLSQLSGFIWTIWDRNNSKQCWPNNLFIIVLSELYGIEIFLGLAPCYLHLLVLSELYGIEICKKLKNHLFQLLVLSELYGIEISLASLSQNDTDLFYLNYMG